VFLLFLHSFGYDHASPSPSPSPSSPPPPPSPPSPLRKGSRTCTGSQVQVHPLGRSVIQRAQDGQKPGPVGPSCCSSARRSGVSLLTTDASRRRRGSLFARRSAQLGAWCPYRGPSPDRANRKQHGQHSATARRDRADPETGKDRALGLWAFKTDSAHRSCSSSNMTVTSRPRVLLQKKFKAKSGH